VASTSGGYAGSVTGGGSVTAVTVSTAADMQAAITAYSGTGGLVIRYTGTFDFSAITDACTQWQKAAGAIVEIKNKSNVTIEGANGSGANFGLAIKGDATNIIIRNMTIGRCRARSTPSASKARAASSPATSGSTTTRCSAA
jgi:pectate lyase